MQLPLATPIALRPGARVAVLAASSPSRRERIETARDHLVAAGLEIVFADNLFSTGRSYLAGNDELRAAEFNRFLRDPSIDGFFFARGGYGAMRILDRIDYAAFSNNPRPLVGFSDVTALNQALAVKTGVASFHGPMLNTDFHDGLSPLQDRWLWSALSGEAPMEFRYDQTQVISHGQASGILFGGCLSITLALLETPYDFWVQDGIWFWEDVDEPIYRIDRMLTQLRLSGRLRNIRGVMIGKLKDCGVSDPDELDSLLSEFFSDSGIPVVRDLPFGHFADNLLMPIGLPAELDTTALTFTLPRPVTSAAVRSPGSLHR
ncbi:MAG: LD-carboxypeptidase [Acidobacteriota bacterium]